MAKIVPIVSFMTVMIMATVVGAYDTLLGVYYGLSGDNLPPPWKVVQLCEKYNIHRVRLNEPNVEVLNAFRGAGIDLSFGVPNSMLTNMATNKGDVEKWFNTYVKPFVDDFKINYIIVGDKAIPGLDDKILPVMKSLQDLFNANYLGAKITTLVGYQASMVSKDPPSHGAFQPTVIENMRGILKFLYEEESPLMVSIFPYQKYKYDGVSLNYAIFNETQPVVRDGILNYYNLFDAMVDTFYAAIDKETVGDVVVVIGETGWPTCGDDNNMTTTAIAGEYNKNFMKHISSGKGTPRKPEIFLEGFIQSIFDEDEKPQGDSQCYGMFDVSMNPTYSLFTAKT